MNVRVVFWVVLTVLPNLVSNQDGKPGDEYVDRAITQALSEVGHLVLQTKKVLDHDEETEGANMMRSRIPQASALDISKARATLDRTLEIIIEKVQKKDPSKKIDTDSPDFVSQVRDLISGPHVRAMWERSGCSATAKEVTCDDLCRHGRYRSYDGSCNNLDHPLWGAVNTPFKRLVKPIYENGLNTPPGWSPGKLYYGRPLPTPRLVSLRVGSTTRVVGDTDSTYMVMLWGQLVDHDIDLTPSNANKVSFSSRKPCATTCDNGMPCFPIPVPEDDPRIQDQKCIDFTRSSAICVTSGKKPSPEMTFAPREQFNVISAFIDASNVYGSSEEAAQALRDTSRNDGSLKRGVKIKNNFMLPVDESGTAMACSMDPIKAKDAKCFLAGDKRVNEHIGLTAIHTIWFREHNRIVAELKNLNPHWDGDKLFEEARKIVGAEMQVITYKEYLPKVLGPVGMRLLGDYKGFDPRVDPSAANSFATASFRFGHAQVRPLLTCLDEKFEPVEDGTLTLDRAFFAPYMFKKTSIDHILRGFMYDPNKAIAPDHLLNDIVTEKLFVFSRKIALDLAAMNIQRGRDHGLPFYSEFRKFCGLGNVTGWKDLAKEISNRDVLEKIIELYGDPRNIDLFIGGLVEDPVSGSDLGPTFMCLVAEQFRRLRDGDRFFYESPGVFNLAQLAEIKKASLARVLCDNGDNIQHAQPDVFRLAKYPEGFIHCSNEITIRRIDLSAWTEATCVGALLQDDAAGFDPAFQTCCCGKVYGSQLSPSPSNQYHCCGDQPYLPAQDTCCSGVLACGKPEEHYRCCGKVAFDPDKEACRQDAVVTIGRLRYCGNDLYVPGEKICCAGLLYDMQTRTTCCDKLAYDPATQICCEGTVRVKSTRFCQCCGYDVYDPETQICCLTDGKGHVHTMHIQLVTFSGRGNTQDICTRGENYPGVLFNTKKQSCCCGEVLEHARESRHSCCDFRSFHVTSQLCCAGKVVDGDPYRETCCGKEKYSLNTQSCCWIDGDLTVVEGVGSCPIHNMGTCGHKSIFKEFNVDREVYCYDLLHDQGHVLPGGPWVRCCGGASYDTRKETCCNGELCHPDKADREEIIAKGKCTKGTKKESLTVLKSPPRCIP